MNKLTFLSRDRMGATRFSKTKITWTPRPIPFGQKIPYLKRIKWQAQKVRKPLIYLDKSASRFFNYEIKFQQMARKTKRKLH